ncbi:quinone-dependent dihydroorotate dehydrogenase [Castellaniella caeni]|uniref:quinone-dependent dihydroorotate dehydrogenase n=1 Tax=Castellaniella caeni TaxID=266123 RepID=UPI00082E0030|nr:quinone-dependent dihydroorotate dehydrogenase [Castellaniella caeni]
MSLLFRTYPLARKALFSMDPEQAHEWTLRALQHNHDCTVTRLLTATHQPTLPRTLMGLPLRNPVGLAAGLDKNGAHIDALAALGFGFIEVGTVTPRAQPGNPKPRMFRLPRARCLINRMGFNNDGLDTFITNVQKSQWRRQGGILGLNIGKNAATPIEHAVDDYLRCLDGVYPHADYITVNISSPNTKNLRSLQSHDALDALLAALQARRLALAEQHGRRTPLVVKIAPDLSTDEVDAVAELIPRHGIDGIIATNTTLSREAVRGLPYDDEAGGLSGPPVHAMSLAVIRRLRAHLGHDTAIIGVGGIESGRQAAEKIQAGADAVQLYTGLIYEGPALIKACVDAIERV